MRLLLWLLLAAVIVFHVLMIVVNVAAAFVLPFTEPWHVAAPLASFVVWITFDRGVCPLTRLENCVRRRLGLPEVFGFIGHYFVRPTRRQLRRLRGLPDKPRRKVDASVSAH